jgi:ABC-2 type transport system permease protein
MRFYSIFVIALREIKSVIKNPYIMLTLLGFHFIQLIVTINTFNNFVGQNSGNSISHAVIEIIGQSEKLNTENFYQSAVLAQLIIMSSIAVAALITSMWENKTIYRIFVSSKSKLEMYLGFFLGYSTGMFIISVLFIALTAFTQHFNWGNAYLEVFVIVLSLIFVCTSVTIFLSSALKDIKLVTAILTFTIIAMTFLSGGIFTGAVFSSVNKYTLNKLAFDAFIGIIEGKPLLNYLSNIIMMISIGLIFSIASVVMLKRGESYE